MTMPSQKALGKMRSGIGSEAASYLIAGINFPSFYGKTFYVDSVTGSNGNNGLTPGQPVATIAYAISLCTAAKGDRILLFPGHVETLATAGAITVNKSGISIIGMGNGALRPTLTLSATDSSIVVSAANVLIQNIRITASIDEVVKVFSVTGAGLTLEAVDVFETASCQIIQFMLTTNAADYLTIRNCRHVQRTAAAATQIWIQLVGVDFATLENNLFLLTLKNEAASYTIGGTTACVDSYLYRNTIQQGSAGNTQDSCVKFATGSTGIMRENCANTTSTGIATAAAFVGDAMAFFDNKWADTIATSGLLAPVVDTDT